MIQRKETLNDYAYMCVNKSEYRHLNIFGLSYYSSNYQFHRSLINYFMDNPCDKFGYGYYDNDILKFKFTGLNGIPDAYAYTLFNYSSFDAGLDPMYNSFVHKIEDLSDLYYNQNNIDYEITDIAGDSYAKKMKFLLDHMIVLKGGI